MPPQYWLYGLAPLNHLYTVARISCWPPEDGPICDPKHVGVCFTWAFNVSLINIELWVHELVIIETTYTVFNFIGSAIHSKHRLALLQTESCVSRWWAGSQQLQAVCLTTNWTHLSLPHSHPNSRRGHNRTVPILILSNVGSPRVH